MPRTKFVLTPFLVILALTSAVYAQKKISVFVDSDPPENATKREVILKVDSSVDSILISSKDIEIEKWQKKDTSKTKDLSISLDTVKDKTIKYEFVAFDFEGKVIGKGSLSVGDKPAKEPTGTAGGTGPGNDKPGPIALSKPKHAVDSLYSVEIRPNDLDLTATKGKYYRVENRVGGALVDQREVSIVRDKNDDKKPSSSQFVGIKLKSGTNEITVEVLADDEKDKDKRKVLKEFTSKLSVDCDSPCATSGQSINTRAIVGFEQVGASSANGKTSPFLDFFINVPLGNNDGAKREPSRFAIWSDFRLTSDASQRFAKLSNISTNILNPAAASEPNDLVQTFRVTGGLEFRLIEEKSLFPGFLPGKASVGFIIGGGFASPLTSSRNSVTEIFQIPKEDGEIIQEFKDLFPNIGNDKDYIGFVTPERDRFQRKWFVGGRLKTRFFEETWKKYNLSPAMLDITFGQDESVTRVLRGFVLGVEGFTPFPVDKLDYIYLYAGLSARLTRRVNSKVPSFFLQNGDLSSLADPLKTVLISADENPLTVTNRDKYFFGIGIDLQKLLRKAQEEPK